VRRLYIVTIILSLLILLVGCGGGKKVKLLEEQLTEEQTRSAQLEQELAVLRNQLTEVQNADRDWEEQLQTKDATIAEQEESLNELRLQNMELKTNLEEQPAKPAAPKESVTYTGDYEVDYQNALDAFNKKWYAQAASTFKSLVQADRNHKLADNAQFWLGECYYAQKQFENALAEFEKVFAYPKSNKGDAAQLKIGLCWLQLGKTEEAKEQLVRLLSTYPSSEHVPRARIILENIQ
jgi:tol-pal system protein YbgF